MISVCIIILIVYFLFFDSCSHYTHYFNFFKKEIGKKEERELLLLQFKLNQMSSYKKVVQCAPEAMLVMRR